MLDNRSKKILWAFGLVLLGIIVIEIFTPEPTNWDKSFTSDDVIPMGCYVFHKEVQPLFSDFEIVRRDPYDFLSHELYQDNSIYVFINTSLYFDKRQSHELLDYVAKGNTLFLSARNVEGVLADSLQVRYEQYYSVLEEEIQPLWYNKNLVSENEPKLKKEVVKAWIESENTTEKTALGYYSPIEKDTEASFNYIATTYGEGVILWHSLPEAFTNYYMLKDTREYTEKVISYWNADTVYWDDYLKVGRKIVSSPMRFVLDQSALTWSYYVLFSGLLLFVLFKGKREQRIIPVIPPVKNTSIEFTKTIGNLYFQHGNYSDIIAKKTTYFFEYIRATYYLDTQNISEKFIKNLALKSGENESEVRELINLIIHLKNQTVHSDTDLMNLNNKIDQFKS